MLFDLRLMPLWGSGLGNCFEIGQKGMRQAQELGSGHQILVVFLLFFFTIKWLQVEVASC